VKVKIFSEYGSTDRLQDEINNWIEENGLNAADIVSISQSECGSGPADDGQITIAVWYIPRPVSEHHVPDFCDICGNPEGECYCDEQSYLTENLPQTQGPRTERPGAEFGAEV
jgi:hypothetical protein